MRNLALWKTTNFSLVEAEFSSSTGATAAASATGSEGSSTVITAVALDLDQDVLYLTTESKTGPDDSEVAVAVWRLSNDDQVQCGCSSAALVDTDLVCAITKIGRSSNSSSYFQHADSVSHKSLD